MHVLKIIDRVEKALALPQSNVPYLPSLRSGWMGGCFLVHSYSDRPETITQKSYYLECCFIIGTASIKTIQRQHDTNSIKILCIFNLYVAWVNICLILVLIFQSDYRHSFVKNNYVDQAVLELKEICTLAADIQGVW